MCSMIAVTTIVAFTHIIREPNTKTNNVHTLTTAGKGPPELVTGSRDGTCVSAYLPAYVHA